MGELTKVEKEVVLVYLDLNWTVHQITAQLLILRNKQLERDMRAEVEVIAKIEQAR